MPANGTRPLQKGQRCTRLVIVELHQAAAGHHHLIRARRWVRRALLRLRRDRGYSVTHARCSEDLWERWGHDLVVLDQQIAPFTPQPWLFPGWPEGEAPHGGH